MGQRSQIYVRYNGKIIIANYYQWNYGERMVSRARAGIEYMKDMLDAGYVWYFKDPCSVTKISRILDVNFDMRDVQISSNILKEYIDYETDGDINDFVFNQDNNDGQLLIDIIDKDDVKSIKYAFVELMIPDDASGIMSAEEYLVWNYDYESTGKDWASLYFQRYNTEKDASLDDFITMFKYTSENISFLQQIPVMSYDEVVDFFENSAY